MTATTTSKTQPATQRSDSPLMAARQAGLRGLVLNKNWFDRLRRERGTPDLPAVLILSEIHQVFGANELADGTAPRFRTDGWWLTSVAAISARAGLHSIQVRRALERLLNLGVITVQSQNDQRSVHAGLYSWHDELVIRPNPVAMARCGL